MLVLFETAAGYAIFKLLDEKKLSKTDNLYDDFQSPEGANSIVKLKHFEKFADTTEALAATTAAVDGKIGKILKKALKKVLKESQEQLLIADAKLGTAIKDKFNVSCVTNNNVQELIRCIRSQTEALLAGLPQKDMAAMALGLAHSLSRYKLKFSPDKVDTMIVQAICLLDELDKELNNYVMRCREWYGWHFPELGKIVADNTIYVKIVKLMGTRDNASTTDMSDILTEDLEERVKEAAEISMGTEISEEDIINIQILCDQVLEMSVYRSQLNEYLNSRMMAIAPNLTVLIGELIGARLISHAGSLVNLAKQPASTVQIFGAEKALFSALKNHKDTPKYGLIYHSNLVANAGTKNKGKISRSLAAKASLAARFDALGEGEEVNVDLGTNHRGKLETRLKFLEEGNLRKLSGTAKAKAQFEKYHSKKEVLTYPEQGDSFLGTKRKIKKEKPLIEEIVKKEEEEPQLKKIKKEDNGEEAEDAGGEPSPKKKKKKKKDITEEAPGVKVKVEEMTVEGEPEEQSQPSKKKKKKKSHPVEE